MSKLRVIGIDFGTSTSVVKVKSYSDNEPIGPLNMVDFVHFDNKYTVPTLVYETKNDEYLLGHDAENAAMPGILHQNFKLDLINPDSNIMDNARKFTQLFIKHLYDAYNDQRGYFPACDDEKTFVSYPAKWPDSVRQEMISMVRKAGFKNVEGLDEPTAAIQTVLVQNRDMIRLDKNQNANILMIDMGAGTTDLVLCSYSTQTPKPITLINVWPKADNRSLFGGRQIDEKLCEFLKAYLVNCGMPNKRNFHEKYMDSCKKWKESNVSQVLKDENGVVRFCGFIDAIVSAFDTDIEFPELSREVLEEMLEDYLRQFAEMINDCFDDAGFDKSTLDYVILTGGHSQWYFTDDILTEKTTKFGRVGLNKITSDKSRVIRLSKPQETVALGLVYQPININAGKSQSAAEGETQVFCGYCGNKKNASQQICPNCNNQILDEHMAWKPDAQAYQGNNVIAVVSSNSNIYQLPYGKDIDGLIYVVNSFLNGTKNMDAQIIKRPDGAAIQARDKSGTWKQFIGMDKALTVRISQIEPGKVIVNIGEAKWGDKVGAMAVSLIVLWPLAVTSGIGMYMQSRLPGEIKNVIASYVMA